MSLDAMYEVGMDLWKHGEECRRAQRKMEAAFEDAKRVAAREPVWLRDAVAREFPERHGP